MAEVWIATSTGLPGKVEIKANGEDGFLATIEFANFNETLAPPDAPANARPLRDAVFPDAPCIGAELADCLAVQSDIAGNGSCAGIERRVCLLPLGKISPDLVDHLVSTYRNQYALSVTVLPPAVIPAELEDPKRQQVDAARLIDYMGSLFPDAYRDPQAVLIGVTPVDLYDSTSHFRYVFGVKGTPSNPKAVVSVLRMNPQFYSEAADGLLFYGRARKLVSKYVGLLYYGLPTSPDPASPMFDSILGPGDVDRMTEPLPVAGAR
jgi:predicted Zn-dependent protease